MYSVGVTVTDYSICNLVLYTPEIICVLAWQTRIGYSTIPVIRRMLWILVRILMCVVQILFFVHMPREVLRWQRWANGR